MEVVRFAGLEIILAKLDLQRGQRWSSRSAAGLWCSVILDGEIDVEEGAFGKRRWQGGVSRRHYADGPTDIEHVSPSASDLMGVFLHVAPENMETVFGADAASAADGLAIVSRIWQRERFITALGWQMLGCSLSASARQLYLSGKGLQLLSYMVDADESIAAVAAQATPSARPREIEQVHAARAMLLADLQDPPTVPELAQAVGLNARRLGELFKLHFGATVHAYLMNARLQRARILLEAGGLSVAQVAYRFGYRPAYFSTEFKRRFGISPATLVQGNGIGI